MRKLVFSLSISLLLTTITIAPAAARKPPMVDGREVVATVAGDPVTRDEFNRELAAMHQERAAEAGANQRKAGRIRFGDVMQRIVTTRLILLEARQIGLDRLEETRRSIDEHARDLLMKTPLLRRAATVAPSPEEIDSQYREMVMEADLISLFFTSETSAQAAAEALQAGRSFVEVGEEFIAADQAAGDLTGGFLPAERLLPEVRAQVVKMQAGESSPLVRTMAGQVLFQLREVRYLEKPEVREQAEALARERKIAREVRAYVEELVDRHARIDEELLKNLDFTARPQEEMAADERVLASLSSGEKITVGDFTRALDDKFHHGLAQAIRSGKVQLMRDTVFHDLVNRKVLLIEAGQQQIESSADYRFEMEKFERSLVFDRFVGQVIAPGVHLSREEVKKAYDKDPQAYSTPEMLRLRSLAFEKSRDAEAAAGRIRQGTAFKWLQENAPGQYQGPKEKLLRFNGEIIRRNGMPAEVQKALAKVGAGGAGVHRDNRGLYHLLYVEEVFPPQLQPFEEVRDDIARRLYREKIREAYQDYARQLRAHYEVKILDRALR